MNCTLIGGKQRTAVNIGVVDGTLSALIEKRPNRDGTRVVIAVDARKIIIATVKVK